MNTRAFLVLLLAALVLGGGTGGVIVGVVALRKGGGDEATVRASSSRLPATEGEATSNELDRPGSARPGDQVLATEPDQETSVQSRGQPQDPDRQRLGDRGVLTGTIDEIKGSTLTISTLQGLSQAIIGPDITIQTFIQGTLADLETELLVTVVGQRGEDGSVEARSIMITPEGGGGFFAGGFGRDQRQSSPEDVDQLRQRFRSGEITQEDLAMLRERFQGQSRLGRFGADGPSGRRGLSGPSSDFGSGFAGGEGLTGTIENVEGNMLTINTSRGPLGATIREDTTIQVFAEGTLADLEVGFRVTVIGLREEDGTVEARSILIRPEGSDGLFGGGFFFGGGQQQERQ